MTTLWVSMAFYSDGLPLWLNIVRLIMIDDGHPRNSVAWKPRARRSIILQVFA